MPPMSANLSSQGHRTLDASRANTGVGFDRENLVNDALLTSRPLSAPSMMVLEEIGHAGRPSRIVFAVPNVDRSTNRSTTRAC